MQNSLPPKHSIVRAIFQRYLCLQYEYLIEPCKIATNRIPLGISRRPTKRQRPAIRLALESRRIRCGDGGAAHCLLFRSEAAVAAQPPAARHGPTTELWRWWKPTNRMRGTPAQITMLIVVAVLSAHIPGSFLPPPPCAGSCSSGQVEISAGARSRHCSAKRARRTFRCDSSNGTLVSVASVDGWNTFSRRVGNLCLL